MKAGWVGGDGDADVGEIWVCTAARIESGFQFLEESCAGIAFLPKRYVVKFSSFADTVYERVDLASGVVGYAARACIGGCELEAVDLGEPVWDLTL